MVLAYRRLGLLAGDPEGRRKHGIWDPEAVHQRLGLVADLAAQALTCRVVAFPRVEEIRPCSWNQPRSRSITSSA